MRSTHWISAAAAAASLLSTAAVAADLYAGGPAPQLRSSYNDPGVSDPSGWYLRGDVGATLQQVDRLHNVDYELRQAPIQQTSIFDASSVVSIGVGYQFNSWLRVDVTGQYRGNANWKGSDRFVYALGGGVQGAAIDTYIASVSSLVFMANAYADLGTWYNITPFVGAGVGTARNTVKGLIDNSIADVSPGVVGPGVAYADPASKWNLAWALHAGMAYRIDPSLTLEMGYHYMNLGDALSGDSITFQGANTHYNPMEYKNITSHDVTIGLRWALDPAPVYAAPPPPLVRKG